MWALVRSASRGRRGAAVLPTHIRAAVASNDQISVSNWLSRFKAVDARHPLNGETMLMIAASRGLAEMVSLLLSSSPPADVDLVTERPIDGRNFSAIMAAAVAGHEEVVRLLLDAGARLEGVKDAVDMAHGDQMLSDEQHMKLRHCCSCCVSTCSCCATECACDAT